MKAFILDNIIENAFKYLKYVVRTLIANLDDHFKLELTNRPDHRL